MPVICRLAIESPRRTIGLALGIVLCAAFGLSRLHLRTDGRALIPADRPEILIDQSIRADFDSRDLFILLVQSENEAGVFNSETVDLVRRLSAEIAALPGIGEDHLVSLATEPNFYHRPGTLKFQNLLEPPLRDRGSLDRLRADIRRIGLYSGTLVSDDEQSTALYIGIPPDMDRAALYRDLQRILANQGDRRERLALIGAPVAEMLLGSFILRDLGVPAYLLEAGGGPNPTAADAGLPIGTSGSGNSLRPGLVPLALLVMMLIFSAVFRSLLAALIPLLEAGCALVFTLGLMGWFGVPFYLTMAPMPVILTAMGIADEVYIFFRYRAETRAAGSSGGMPAIFGTMQGLWRPIVFTSITTAIGFGSFALSPLEPLRFFGLFTGAGILFCMIWSLTVVPALLLLLPIGARREGQGNRSAEGVPLRRLVEAGLEVVYRARRLVGLSLLTLMLILPVFISRLTVQDSWLDGFDPRGSFRRVVESFNRHFFGSHLLLIEVDGQARVLPGEVPVALLEDRRFRLPSDLLSEFPGGLNQLVDCKLRFWVPTSAEMDTTGREWYAEITAASLAEGYLVLETRRESGSPLFWLKPDPDSSLAFAIESRPFEKADVLRHVAGLKQHIAARDDLGVGGVLAPSDFLETTAFMLRPDEPQSRRLPEDARDARALWSRYRFVRGEAKLRQLVDGDYGKALIQVYLGRANFADTTKLLAAIREYERDSLAPLGLSLAFGGDVAVSQALIDEIVKSQLYSLGFSLLGIFLAALLLFRSWLLGWFAILPSAAAVAVNFAFLGGFGIPIGVATSMFAGMTLGIGVDFAIHLIESYRAAVKAGLIGREAIVAAMVNTAPANGVNALVVGLGFGLLMFSAMPVNVRLGLLTTVGVTCCGLVTLIVLPLCLDWIAAGPKRGQSRR